MSAQHFIGISGGKDSELTAIKAVERFAKRPPSNMPPRFLAADTGNEDDGWRDFIDYLARALGVAIEVLRADFTREFAVRRANIAREWRQEKRSRNHSAECRDRRETMTVRARMKLCTCPETVVPPVPEAIIAQAAALLEPTGNPFLDLCMLKARFPGMMSRFCTEELKIVPMAAVKRPYLDAGVSIVEWLGERAQEGERRARKPVLSRTRHPSGASQIIYRPLHAMKVEQVFAEIAARGLRVNPLYDLGASRVGCWPCAFCGKDDVALIARHSPEHIDRLREWERIVGLVSRRRMATFFCAKTLPGVIDDPGRAHIDAIVEWSKTSRGGRQFDMFQTRMMEDSRELFCLADAVVCE